MYENPSPIFMAQQDDPAMVQAVKSAQQKFRFFWRELAWEHRRILPALDVACVKAPFSDSDEESEVEQMWFNEISFDGKFVSGKLVNSPNRLKSVKVGDTVHLPITGISDWMYAIRGQVFGGYTVNAIRAGMSSAERKSHDKAWGMNFGDHKVVQVIPREYFEPKKSFLGKLFSFGKAPGLDIESLEHPMSENMGDSLRSMLQENPQAVHETDDRGFNFLHELALAGSQTCVKVALEQGADPSKKTKQGLTALDLAKSLSWTRVISQLS